MSNTSTTNLDSQQLIRQSTSQRYNNSDNSGYYNNSTQSSYDYNPNNRFYQSSPMNSYGSYGTNNSMYSGNFNGQFGANNDPRQNQIPPPTFKNDFWGVLNGFSCVLNILYAGTGLVNYGKIFLKMSLKVIKFVCGKSLSFIFKITGLRFLKKILFRVNQLPWGDEFLPQNALDSIWNHTQSEKGIGIGSTLLGNFINALRICSLLGNNQNF